MEIQRGPIKVDILSQAFIILAVMVSTFFITYWTTDPNMAFRSLFMMVLLIGGISVGNSWGFLTIDKKKLAFGNVLYYALIGFIALAVTQILSVSLIPASTADATANLMLGILAGIGEEAFFRGVIFPWIWRRSGNPVLGIIGNSAIFAVTHMSAYNLTSNLPIFFALFLNGIVFSVLVYITRRLSVAQSAHVILNIVASGVLPI